MTVLTQIRAVTAMNLLSLPQRLASSCVVVVGIAGVVGVLVSVLGITTSLEDTLLSTGRSDRAIVLREGANAEVSSGLSVDATLTILDAPGIARTGDGGVAATIDMVTGVNLEKNDGSLSAVSLRGMSASALAVRPEIELVEGRFHEPGLRELIVGASAQGEFTAMAIGDTVALRDSEWTIVGVFTSGDALESGMLTDVDTLMSTYQRTGGSSVTVLLESDDAFDTFRDALTTNPALTVDVLREVDYYRRQSEGIGDILTVVTSFVAGIMAVGALFAALNTMYQAVSSRGVEIATLRAIGFGSSGVVASVLFEALLLALFGAVLGAAIAWTLFSGNTINVGGQVSSIVFQLQVSPALVGQGIALACFVGFVGGLFPAIRAAGLPVATALRAV